MELEREDLTPPIAGVQGVGKQQQGNNQLSVSQVGRVGQLVQMRSLVIQASERSFIDL